MSVKKELRIQYEWDGTLLESIDQVPLEVKLTDEGLHIKLQASLYHDPEPPTPPDPEKGTWELWGYEVVELFLVGERGEYTEIEMGPWGHHLVLQLDAPRSIVRKEIPMQFTALETEGGWSGEGFVSREWLPDNIVRANAFAIHTVNGNRRYCCYTPLQGSQPDFHQPARFVSWDDFGNG